MTGCRRGEALGLTWRDLDIEGGRVAIRRALVPVDGKLVETEPKTKRGRRLIALDAETVAVLRHRLPLSLPNSRSSATTGSTAGGCSPRQTVRNCIPSASAPCLPVWCGRGAAADSAARAAPHLCEPRLGKGRQCGDRLATTGARHRGLHLGHLLPRAASGRCRGGRVHRGVWRPRRPKHLNRQRRIPGCSPGWLADCHSARPVASCRGRSIPTRAGIPAEPAPEWDIDGVRPHARRDSSKESKATTPKPGPSPRAWGFRELRRTGRRRPRSIPRAWGFQLCRGVHVALVRSIPTRVGIPVDDVAKRVGAAVHPHAWGFPGPERRPDRQCRPSPRAWGFRPRNISRARQYGGPSPRAWGFRPDRTDRVARYRSIPTRVGILDAREGSRSPAPVHPHARGDSAHRDPPGGPGFGPSPRAWGSCRRSIPMRLDG